jgi:hypothetical protein
MVSIVLSIKLIQEGSLLNRVGGRGAKDEFGRISSPVLSGTIGTIKTLKHVIPTDRYCLPRGGLSLYVCMEMGIGG